MFLFFFRLKLEPEILNCQLLSSVLSQLIILYLPEATSSSIIIKTVFEELNDEGSDTVFHA